MLPGASWLKLFIFLFSITQGKSLYQWAFLGGSKTTSSTGNYGPVGVPSKDFIFSARNKVSFASDKERDIIYIFGGNTIDYNSNLGELNDLWMFNASSLEYTFIGGDRLVNSRGVYQNKGNYTSNGWPRARWGNALFFSSKTNELYLFGGMTGFEVGQNLNDVWSYNIETGQWRWIAGASDGYSSLQDTITPRSSPLTEIVEDESCFYIYGGADFNHQTALGDFYKYNYTNNTWTPITKRGDHPEHLIYVLFYLVPQMNSLITFAGFVDNPAFRTNNIWTYDLKSGYFYSKFRHFSNNTYGLYPSFKMIPSHLFYPGARNDYYGALDPRSSFLFVFGGYGYTDTSAGGLNDLWMFSILNNTWTWIGGSKLAGQASRYGMKGVASLNNLPGGRYNGATHLSLKTGLIFILAGSITGDAIINEFWNFQFSIPSKENPQTSTKSSELSRALEVTLRPILLNDNSSNYQPISLTTIIIVVVVILCLAITITSYFCCIRKTNSSGKPKKQDIDSSITQNSVMTSASLTNNSTLFTKVQGLAVPGYLIIQPNEFQLTKVLAKGGGGEVYLATPRSRQLALYGNLIIVKLVGESFDQLTESKQNAFNQEITVVSYLKGCKYIAEIIGFCTSPCCILMKFYPFGSLEKLIEKQIYSKKMMMLMLLDISKGIEETHAKDIAHLDLKPHNVLVYGDFTGHRCALSDFGISHILSDKLLLVKEFRVANLKGFSPAYASPETFIRFKSRNIQKANIVKASDIYSFACIIYEFIIKKAPWH